jgi:HK97 family phage prohead protease
MPMKPRKGESQSDFTARCVPEMMGDGKREQDQAVAACLDIWRNRDKEHTMRKDNGDNGDMPDPDDYDDYDEFLPDCMDAGFDEDACRSAYRGERSADGIVHKTHAGEINGSEYVLSDETPDRMGDIIESAGWDLRSFKSNPIALFGHKSDFPIGRWRNVGVNKDKQLRGHLELAPKGTSPRIDEIRALVDAGILRAVSVGFKPIDSAPLNHKEPFGGQRFSKQELVECSLVAVPANPNALSVAKSLKISDDTQSLVFAKHGKGNGTVQRAVVHGKPATRTPDGKKTIMTPLTQRITDAQARIVALKAALGEHLGSIDDSNVTDEQMNQTTEFNNKIVQEERTLAMLVESEKHIAAATAAEHGTGGATSVVTRDNRSGMSTRPFSMPTKKFDPIDVLVRGCMVQMYSHQRKTSLEDTRAWLAANGNPNYNDDTTKAYIEWHTKAASAPAMTTVTGWAAELVQTVYAAFMESLFPKSVYPRLAAKGLDLSFGRAGKISIPTRALTPTIAGSFVGEGAPIPVRQGAFTAQVLTPKKMAVITTWTREMDEHSVPAIEGLLRQAIQDDTAIAIDSVLLDTNAATAVRPAGLLNGVTPLTATAGGGFNALVGDIKQLSGALLTATRGNVRSPAWIMNPQQVMSAGLTPAPASGVFPFDTSGGNLNGWPIIDSGTVPMGTIIAMDAADFVGAGENPRFEISDQATLHFEDTAPADIVAGTPATPVKSLWQTDSIGLRLILPLNWLNRRPGTVAAIVGVTW